MPNDTTEDLQFAKDYSLLATMIMEPTTEDRVVAIVSAAYMEKWLVDLIAEFFPGMDDNRALKKAMFDEVSGMAGTLGRRLDMARALNAITPGTYADGATIGKIRNKFAHNLEVTSFDHSKVSGLVDNLQYGRDQMIDEGGKKVPMDTGWSRPERFRSTALAVCAMIMSHHIKEYPFSYSSGDASFATRARPPSLDKLNKPPRREG